MPKSDMPSEAATPTGVEQHAPEPVQLDECSVTV